MKLEYCLNSLVLKQINKDKGLGFLSTLFKSEPKSKINAQLN